VHKETLEAKIAVMKKCIEDKVLQVDCSLEFTQQFRLELDAFNMKLKALEDEHGKL